MNAILGNVPIFVSQVFPLQGWGAHGGGAAAAEGHREKVKKQKEIRKLIVWERAFRIFGFL